MPLSALAKVRKALRQRGAATRPQLATDTGLSLVSCNQAVAELCRNGEAEAAGVVPSGGGRPVRLYQLNTQYAYGAYFQAHRRGALIQGTLEICDMLGKTQSTYNADFAYLGAESLDAWLDKEARRHKLYGISLEIAADIMPPRLIKHLEARYQCPTRLLNTADALADDKEDTLTLYIRQGEAPVCSLRHNGAQQHTGELGLLPLPADWSKLDYSDHTLVEEMIARLITILACTLAPARCVIFADFWSPRLTKRIRFNVSSKLHQEQVALHFRSITPALAAAILRTFACTA